MRPVSNLDLAVAGRCGLAVLALSACAPGLQRDTDSGAIGLERPLTIAAGTAHTVFQGGRQTGVASWLEPWCELEIETVAPHPQEALTGRSRVVAARFALLRDPISRLPALVAGFGCSDPLYRESLWLLRGEPGANLHSLRCIRPGFHCRVPLPLTLPEVPAVTGPAIRVFPPGAGGCQRARAATCRASEQDLGLRESPCGGRLRIQDRSRRPDSRMPA